MTRHKARRPMPDDQSWKRYDIAPAEPQASNVSAWILIGLLVAAVAGFMLYGMWQNEREPIAAQRWEVSE